MFSSRAMARKSGTVTYFWSSKLVTVPLFRFPVAEYNRELDRRMRQCAWRAVVDHPLTGVTDENGNGVADEIE